MEKYSVIDIGSNSIRLLNTAVEDGKIISGEKHLRMTRLGKNVDSSKMLTEESMEQTFDALIEFKKMSEEFGGELIGAYATSAVRDSLNKEYFTKEAYKRSGIEVEVISGEEEAYLGYLGVLAGLQDFSRVLIIDIGGGSTELITGDRSSIERAKSLNVGAVRMTGKHLFEPLVTDLENTELIKDIMSIVKYEMEHIIKFNPDAVVGIGGTVTTLGAMKLKMETYDREKIHNYTVSLDDIIAINKDLKSKGLEERKQIPGLQPKRADIIYAGGVILQCIMEGTNLSHITVSDFDNLEGQLVKKNIVNF